MSAKIPKGGGGGESFTFWSTDYFIRPPAIVHCSIVICVPRDWLQTTYSGYCQLIGFAIVRTVVLFVIVRMDYLTVLCIVM